MTPIPRFIRYSICPNVIYPIFFCDPFIRFVRAIFDLSEFLWVRGWDFVAIFEISLVSLVFSYIENVKRHFCDFCNKSFKGKFT